MKTKNITTALVCAALAAPVGLVAQASELPDARDQQQSGYQSDQHRLHGTDKSSEIKRISSDKLEEKVTAKQLLDKEVYDNEGNRIGSVSDFAIGDALPRNLAQQLGEQSDGMSRDARYSPLSPSFGGPGQADGKTGATAGSSRAGAGVGSGQERDASVGSSPAGAGQPGSSAPGATAGTQQRDSVGGAGQQGDVSIGAVTDADRPSPGAGAQQRDTAGSTMGDTSASSPSYAGSELGSQDEGQQLTLFVELGDDTIAIPASQLSYDEENEHFTLAMSKEEIEEIAKGRSDAEGRDLSAIGSR